MHPILLGRSALHPKLPTELHDREGRMSGALMAFSWVSAARQGKSQTWELWQPPRIQLYFILCVTITITVHNDNAHLSSAYLLTVCKTLLYVLCKFTHLILTATLTGRDYDCSHCTDEETDTQKSKII